MSNLLDILLKSFYVTFRIKARNIDNSVEESMVCLEKRRFAERIIGWDKCLIRGKNG